MSTHFEASPSTAVDYDPFADGGVLARVVPTTEAQREIWLACQLGGDANLAYNEAVSLHLRGDIDLAALAAAVQDLSDRHEALRSTIGGDGHDLFVADHLAVNVQKHDLSTRTVEARQAARRAHAETEVRTPFDLEHGPLFRAQLLILSTDEAELILAAHHIICDGWSFGVLIGDLAALYASQHGGQSALEPAVGYADFAQRLAERSAGAEHAADEVYWLDRYAEPAPILDLPCDRPRPPQRTFTSQRVDHPVSKELLAQLRQLGARSGASLFSTLLTAFGALLQRLAGTDEVVIGVPTAGQALPGFERTVGHGVNLLPLRISPTSAAPFADSLPAVQRTVLDGFEHQHYTLGTLLRKLVIERDPSRVPLAPVMFNLDRAVDLSGFAGLEATLVGIPRCAENFELFVNAVPQTDGSLQLECQYSTTLFDEATVRRWLACYETLLREICAQPTAALEQLEIASPSDRAALARLNATQQDFPPDLLVHQLLATQAQRTPEATAVICGQQRLSYATLWQQSCRIAHALRSRGVQRGVRVGLCLPRNADLLPALLGTLLAGATYVPLDPTFPPARLADMAKDADLAWLLTDSSVAGVLPWPRYRSLWLDTDAERIGTESQDTPKADPIRDADPDAPAYMIYTSGSTGKPKGVIVPHRAVVNFLLAVKQRPGLDSTDCLLAVTTLSFDIAVLELLLPLTVGARVLLATSEQAVDGFALRDLLEAEPVSVLQATPSTWRLLFSAGWQARSGFKALVGGEALPVDLAAQLRQTCTEVWNLYGPTETTVWSSCWQVPTNAASISIGTPLANTHIHILDGHGRLCPIGIPGEIHIGGRGVTRGYWHRSKLTAERFVPDPSSAATGARLYRTGDRGRWRNDGLLEHLGRLDFQVKLRGFRIELGDIETHLCTHPQVAQAVATVREDTPGDARLVAYVVPRTAGSAPEAAALRDYLRQRLPSYMLPQHLVPLIGLPLLPNGKVDRKRLPSPAGNAATTPATRRSPRTATEKTVAEAMQRVLHLPELALDDDFFALGGHSLLAAQLAMQLCESSGLDLQMRSVFDTPTIAGLAQWIDSHAVDLSSKATVITHRADQARAPASLQQGRVWFLEQLNPGLPIHNTPSAHRLRGVLDRQALEQAINVVVARQSSLRTGIVKERGVPIQIVVPELEVQLGPVDDLSALPSVEREAELLRRLQARSAELFDLTQPPLFKLGLYRMGERDHVLFFMPHHIIWDGWSFDLLYKEMSILYPAFAAGLQPKLPPLPLSYGDYAAWQQSWIDSPEMRRQLDYWREALAHPPSPLNLPTDHPRPKYMSGRGNTHWFKQDAAWFKALHQFALQQDATPYMVLLSCFAVLLWRLSKQTDIVVGTPIRGRPSIDLEPVMGFMVNALPLRLRLNPAEPFSVLISKVRRVVLDAFGAPDAPLEKLLQFTPGPRDFSRTPVYQSFFSYQDVRQRIRNWGELQQENLKVYQPAAAEDVRLWFLADTDGVVGGLTYNVDVFDESRVAQWMGHYVALVADAIAHPYQAVQTLPSMQGVDAGGAEAATPTRVRGLDIESQATADAGHWTPTEKHLALIWSDLLGIPSIDRGGRFFDLGGHPQLAEQAIARMDVITGKRVDPLCYVCETLAQIALEYDRTAHTQSASSGGLLRRWLGHRNHDRESGSGS